MRTAEEVQGRIRSLLLQEFDRRVAEAEQRLPCNCTHNHRQALDSRKELAGDANEGYNRINRKHLPLVPTIGLCLLGSDDPETWKGDICDDPIDAQRCPYFSSLSSKDSLLAAFKEQVEDVFWVQTHLPEVHALLWVLNESSANFQLPWWKRCLFWFLRLRTEPVQPQGVSNLLPSGDDGVHGS